jgi:hypothetical protein
MLQASSDLGRLHFVGMAAGFFTHLWDLANLTPSHPRMWVWCNSMKRFVYFSMCAFDFASNIA